MHLTQAQRGGHRWAAGSAGQRSAARGAAALAGEPAGAGARHAPLGLHLPAAELAGLRGIGGGEQAPARVAALCAADRLQPHRANGVHRGRRTLSDFLSKRNEVRTHTSRMEGKRVSWVELYLDLVFVLAVGQLAHLIVARAGDAQRVDRARAVLRRCGGRGSASRSSTTATARTSRGSACCSWPASVPAGVAAVAIEPASTGDSTVFALSLAVTRLVLAGRERRRRARARSCCSSGSRARCLVSAALFLVSIVGARRRSATSLWAIADRHRVRRDAARGPRGDAPRAPRRATGASSRRPTRPRRSTRTTSPSASGCS